LTQGAVERAITSSRDVPKPTDNGLIESFNGRLRDEFLNVHDFVTMHDLREKLRVWQEDYNHRRPHGSLANLTRASLPGEGQDQPAERHGSRSKPSRFRGNVKAA
jgi:transposase InsO family protein